MSQTRTKSLLEACTNIMIGYVINIGINAIVFKSMGIPVTTKQNLGIGLLFTFVSLTRTYLIRRIWEGR